MSTEAIERCINAIAVNAAESSDWEELSNNASTELADLQSRLATAEANLADCEMAHADHKRARLEAEASAQAAAVEMRERAGRIAYDFYVTQKDDGPKLLVSTICNSIRALTIPTAALDLRVARERLDGRLQQHYLECHKTSPNISGTRCGKGWNCSIRADLERLISELEAKGK